MEKEKFKIFVRNHPILINHVRNKKMTWQQFYELYDLYGEDDKIWNEFLDGTNTINVNENLSNNRNSGNNNTNNQNTNNQNINNDNIAGTIKNFLGLFKGIDMNTVQRTLGSLDKAIEAFKGISSNNNDNGNRTSYEERPKYKYFED